MIDLERSVVAVGGPFFAAYWKYPNSTGWSEERFRLFRNARDRLNEEKGVGAVMGYVRHLVTDEVVWSFGGGGDGLAD